jgi:hypothetical protein
MDTIHQIKNNPDFGNDLYYTARSIGFNSKEIEKDVYYRCYKKSFIEKWLNRFGYYKTHQEKTSYKQSQGSGSCAIVLKPQHADISRTLVVHGNCWVDLTQEKWDKGIKDVQGRTDKIYLNYIKDCIKLARQDIMELSKSLKELEEDK